MDKPDLCPDCRHKVSDHDMFGCTLYGCTKFPRGGACELTGEFLIEYFGSTEKSDDEKEEGRKDRGREAEA